MAERCDLRFQKEGDMILPFGIRINEGLIKKANG